MLTGRNVSEATDEAYNSVLFAKKRPVDIIVGTNSHFEKKGKSKHSLMVEGEVQKNGILLYDRTATYTDCHDMSGYEDKSPIFFNAST